jgi:transposase
LLPPALDEWVPPTHPVRFVSDFVDSLDLTELGIHQPEAEEGRPPYGSDLLLKVWLFGYMERIRSTRALEKACVQVMPFLWLTGLLRPDHNTLWRFFNTNRAALPKLFKKLVKTAAAAELIGFALHALDGTKMTAASSTDAALHRKGLEERLKRLDEFIAAYMAEVTTRSDDDKGKPYLMPEAMANEDARRARLRALLERRIEEREDKERADETSAQGSTTAAPQPSGSIAPAPSRSATVEPSPTEGTASPASSAESPPSSEKDPLLREAEALREETRQGLALLDQADVKHLHEKEPEARMMKGRGFQALGYNAQAVVDHDSDLIVGCDVVTDQNDLNQLVPMLDQIKETFGRVAAQSVADNGYASGEQLKSAEDHGLPALVFLRDEPEVAGEFAKANFRYEAADDVYVCPKGERLVQIGKNKSHASAKEPDTLYRCMNKTCPVRDQCTKDPRGRKVRRPYGEDARERQAQKQLDPRMRVLLGLRKEIIEHLFGIVKTIDGFRRFTVRGLEKARPQWSLICTAINLRKLSAMAVWKAGKLERLPARSAPATPATA